MILRDGVQVKDGVGISIPLDAPRMLRIADRSGVVIDVSIGAMAE